MDKPYNDPYKMLANAIVIKHSDHEISRILHDNKAIRRYIAQELRESDYHGDFLDCVLVGLVKTGDIRGLGPSLRQTVWFFFRALDVSRLRKEIRTYLERYGKNIS